LEKGAQYQTDEWNIALDGSNPCDDCFFHCFVVFFLFCEVEIFWAAEFEL